MGMQRRRKQFILDQNKGAPSIQQQSLGNQQILIYKLVYIQHAHNFEFKYVIVNSCSLKRLPLNLLFLPFLWKKRLWHRQTDTIHGHSMTRYTCRHTSNHCTQVFVSPQVTHCSCLYINENYIIVITQLLIHTGYLYIPWYCPGQYQTILLL